MLEVVGQVNFRDLVKLHEIECHDVLKQQQVDSYSTSMAESGAFISSISACQMHKAKGFLIK